MRALKGGAIALGLTLAVACGGGPTAEDAGVDAGVDAGFDAGPPPVVDAGPPPVVDAGPPPPRTVFGSMTVNGVPYTLSSGYGTTGPTAHIFRIGSDPQVRPNVQLSIVLASDAGAGFAGTCGTPQTFLTAQYVGDAGIAYYTLNATCAVGLSQVALDAGQDYAGTFSAALGWEPRSVYDAGMPVLNLTAGSFTVHRTF